MFHVISRTSPRSRSKKVKTVLSAVCSTSISSNSSNFSILHSPVFCFCFCFGVFKDYSTISIAFPKCSLISFMVILVGSDSGFGSDFGSSRLNTQSLLNTRSVK